MKAKIGILPFLIALVFFLCVSKGESQMKDFVTLISQNDAAFAPLMHDHYDSIYQKLPESVKTSTFVLNNSSSKGIAGYVIKWNVEQGSTTKTMFEAFDRLHLIGTIKPNPSHYWVAPHTTRLLNPIFSIHESEVNAVGSNLALEDALSKHPAAKLLTDGAKYIPALDLVVFEDGMFIGPDEGHFSQRMVGERNGKHDIGVEILLAQKNGRSVEQIQTILKGDILKSQSAAGVKENDFYLQAKGRYASQLLVVSDQLGSNALTKNATVFASMSHIKLKRTE